MIIILLISIVVCMAAWQIGYFLLWKKEFFVTLSFGQPYVYAGEDAELIEVVENHKKLPVSPVEIGFRMRKGILFKDMENASVSDFVYKRDIFSLLGNQRIIRKLNVQCQKRGRYEIKEVSISTFSLLHERKYSMEQQTDTRLYVYAKRTDVSAILRAMENLLGEKESKRKYLEDPFLFASIRKYTIQDPMKNINWKASAKTGELMVNTYASLENERMMLYLDVEDRGILKKEHLIEDSISVAASLFQKLLAKGIEVGICMNLKAGNRENENRESKKQEQTSFFAFQPSRKRETRILLEQKLAEEWEEKEVLPFEKLMECSFGDAIPVIISKNFSEKKKQQIEEFIGSGTKGIWVIPYEKGEMPQIASDRFTVVKREVDEV